jgi:DNA mismatch repair protein MutS2
MTEIKPGDFVTIVGQDNVGEVISVRGNNVEVAIGIMKVMVKLNKVSLAEPPEEEKSSRHSETSTFIDTKEKMMHFRFELDLRGKMKDDVMVELAIWIDDAILLGVEEAKILHGRGTGVIKDTVRSMLRKYKEVEKAGDEKEGRGDAVTVVRFKIE